MSIIHHTPSNLMNQLVPKLKSSMYDGYLQYWSTKYDEVINCYCESLLVSHCTHEQLL